MTKDRLPSILGENGAGKSTLLRLLAKKEQPLEGKIHHASNVNVGYFDQHVVDELIESQSHRATTTALSLLTERFPKKSEQDIRGELTAFGLSPKQALTNIKFLSGGERSRLCLATLMLGNPEVLIMDEPTSHLDRRKCRSIGVRFEEVERNPHHGEPRRKLYTISRWKLLS